MQPATRPSILGIAEDRVQQEECARRLNDDGLHYRFTVHWRQLSQAVEVMNPDFLMIWGEVASDFTIRVIDELSNDVLLVNKPVVVVSVDLSDAVWISGFRTGVVAILPPQIETHLELIHSLMNELPYRSGVFRASTDQIGFTSFIDHLRRTRRTGVLTVDPGAVSEGRATFLKGRLDRCRFLGSSGREALTAMGQQPRIHFTFAEVSGTDGSGSGVVLSMTSDSPSKTPTHDPWTSTLVRPESFELVVGDFQKTAPITLVDRQKPLAAPVRPRILVVDDDEAILRMFSTLFTRNGYDVRTASDGVSGLEMTRIELFDLILADLNMPYLDGWGMLRLIREDFATREIPIAFVSAHDDYRESLKALDAGAQGYLSKGTRLESLVAQVKQLLHARDETRVLFAEHRPTALDLAAIGPQWILRQLAAQRESGVLSARDGWCQYQIGFVSGACVFANAVAGKFSASGETALTAYVASRGSEGFWSPNEAVDRFNLEGDLSTQLLHACATLNAREKQLRDALFVSAHHVNVNADLYAVYQQVGPKKHLKTAQLICEEKIPPRELMARLDASPVDIEEAVSDLVRRAVISLSA